MPNSIPRPPGTVPLVCAILAYVIGFAGVALMFVVFDKSSRDGWIGTGFYCSITTMILDVIAFIGGIAGIARARKANPRAGIGRSVIALVMGLLGFIGVFLLLLLTALAGVTAR